MQPMAVLWASSGVTLSGKTSVADHVADMLQAFNLSDPSGFFEDISAVPTLANRTVISVHIYGPNITVRAPFQHASHLTSGA